MENPNAKRRQMRKRIVVCVLTLIMGGSLFVGLSGLNSAQDSEKLLSTASSEAMDLLELKELLTRQREQILSLMLAKNNTERKSLEAGIRKRSRQIDGILDTFSEIAREDTTLNQQLQELKKVRAESAETRDKQVLPLIYAGRTAEARQLLTGVQQQRFNRMRELSKAIAVSAQNKAFFVSAEVGRKSDRAFNTFIVTSIIALVAGTGMVLFVSRATK
jgi:hypothetical protein